MSRPGRVRSSFRAAWASFLRRRTAVFFTFFFPVILILIFGALVQTNPGGTGLFTEPAAYYVPGYLAVVVLFTPLSRLGSEVARHRDSAQFEKLATTPLTRGEWLLAQTLVNGVIISLASLLVLGLTLLVTDAAVVLTPVSVAWLAAFVVAGVVCFCGVGALLGSGTDSQDGAISASNALGLPLLFLSETFVPLDLLPEWFAPVVSLSPLTYFARGVRAATVTDASGSPTLALAVLAGVAVVAFAVAAATLPRTD